MKTEEGKYEDHKQDAHTWLKPSPREPRRESKGDGGSGQGGPWVSGRQEAAQTAPRGPYRDVVVQGLAVQPLILCSDVQEVDLAARHHDADQGPVLGSCSLESGPRGVSNGPPPLSKAPVTRG